MSAAKLTEDVVVAATALGARVFRNNTGTYQTGGRWIRYGVGPPGGGGGDLLGWTKEGLFLSIEIKYGNDKPTKSQLMWIEWVKKGGGRAGIARSVEDAIKIINGE